MKVKDVVRILDGEVLSGEDKLDCDVARIGAGDMMSDVLALAQPGMIILSSQTSPQAVRTGLVTEVLGLVVVAGKNIPHQTIEMAKANDFLLIRTRSYMFVSCGKLYSAGFKGIE